MTYRYLLPVTPLAYRAVMRVLHLCPSLARFWGVFQLLFGSFILASAVRRQVTLGLPLFCFPSGVQKRAIFITMSESLLRTWPKPSDDDCGHVLLLAPVAGILI